MIKQNATPSHGISLLLISQDVLHSIKSSAMKGFNYKYRNIYLKYGKNIFCFAFGWLLFKIRDKTDKILVLLKKNVGNFKEKVDYINPSAQFVHILWNLY